MDGRGVATLGSAGHASAWPSPIGGPTSSAASSASPRRRTPPAGASGRRPRPRGVGVLFGLQSRTPFDRQPGLAGAARACRCRSNCSRSATPARRAQLIAEAERAPAPTGPERCCSSCRRARPATTARPRAAWPPTPTNGAGCRRPRRSSSWRSRPTAPWSATSPSSTSSLGAVEEMLDDPLVTLGLADAGAHVGQIMDASQPTFYLTYWIRERGRWGIEEAVRRLTSDTARAVRRDGPGRAAAGRLRRRQRHRPRRAHAPPAGVRARLPGRRRPLRPGQQRATTTRWSTARSSWTTASTPARCRAASSARPTELSLRRRSPLRFDWLLTR